MRRICLLLWLVVLLSTSGCEHIEGSNTTDAGDAGNGDTHDASDAGEGESRDAGERRDVGERRDAGEGAQENGSRDAAADDGGGAEDAAADGGGDVDSGCSPSSDGDAVAVNAVELTSDFGDYIGAGKSYSYDDSNALFQVTFSSGTIQLSVTGDERWNGSFAFPQTQSQIMVGHYGDLTRWPFHDTSHGGLSWSGEGRGCNTLTGSFDVLAVNYEGNELSSFELKFEQHCEGSYAALRGTIQWDKHSKRVPDCSLHEVPNGLWKPANGATPASGRYVYLTSQQGDFVGAGSSYTYTQMNAVLTLQTNGGRLSIQIAGDEDWTGDFVGGQSEDRLVPGYYGVLHRYPFHNPVKGGLSWSGEGRGCNELEGWFVLDEITYTNNVVTALTLRFEQHCDGQSAALHGVVHWTPEDTSMPPGPVNPPPADLWKPADGVTPDKPRFVYLQSGPGDYIGQGQTLSYTQADAVLQLTSSAGAIHISVTGDQDWTGDFVASQGVSQLAPGYYAGLARYPFHNPVKGGLDWSGEGRGCNMLTGWFAIDGITYASSTVSTLDLRFEQHCEGGSSALHGVVHWSASDPTAPPGPIVPAPGNLWAPGAGDTPSSGSYVYLQSDAGDYIGQGQTMSYSLDASAITEGGAAISVSVSGWYGNFKPNLGLSRLEPGYYGDLMRASFSNPVKGGLEWSGQGRGCNTISGWFVVDSVTYTNNDVTALDLRFEQHCEGGSAALHGKIHLGS